jgi:uncharacterized protein YkwD
MRIWMVIALVGCGPISSAPAPATSPPASPEDPYAAAPPSSEMPPSVEPAPEGDPPPGREVAHGGDPAEIAPDPAVAAPGSRGPTRGRGSTPAGKTPAPSNEAQRLVDAHNRVRAKHCAKPLAWSAKLAQVAQQWANALRDKGCVFGHSGGSFGENLAAGTSGTLDAEDVVKMWYDEVSQYRFPNGGFSAQTGHFTQVVWRGTARVGCGRSQCNNMDIWVCEYDPAGNWQGQYRENVLPAGCR